MALYKFCYIFSFSWIGLGFLYRHTQKTYIGLVVIVRPFTYRGILYNKNIEITIKIALDIYSDMSYSPNIWTDMYINISVLFHT